MVKICFDNAPKYMYIYIYIYIGFNNNILWINKIIYYIFIE